MRCLTSHPSTSTVSISLLISTAAKAFYNKRICDLLIIFLLRVVLYCCVNHLCKVLVTPFSYSTKKVLSEFRKWKFLCSIPKKWLTGLQNKTHNVLKIPTSVILSPLQSLNRYSTIPKHRNYNVIRFKLSTFSWEKNVASLPRAITEFTECTFKYSNWQICVRTMNNPPKTLISTTRNKRPPVRLRRDEAVKCCMWRKELLLLLGLLRFYASS